MTNRDTSVMISVIVPVYNVQLYLEKCLVSICNQSYKNLEIILVNDGSTDDSLDICEEYAEKDSRIKLISQKNGGLSDARNTGIRNATGDFIFFVDSDDFIEKDAIEKLVNGLSIEHTEDILLANGTRIQNDLGKCIKKMPCAKEYISGKDYLLNKLQSDTYYPAVWLNLYSLRMIKDNELYFKKRRLHEDVEWFPRVLVKAGKVKELNINVYNYVIRDNSITTNRNQRNNGLDILKTVTELATEIKFTKKRDKRIFEGYLSNIYLNAIYIGNLDKREYEKHFPIKNAYTCEQFVKAIIFEISPRLYFYLRRKKD